MQFQRPTDKTALNNEAGTDGKTARAFRQQTGNNRSRFGAFRLLLLIMAAIFGAELTVMFVLDRLSGFPYSFQAFLDASLLIIFIFPIIYYCSFRPIVRNISLRLQAEEELQDLCYHLEKQVERRTAELSQKNFELKEKIAEHLQTEKTLLREREFSAAVLDTTRALVKDWEETFDTINDAITVHDKDFNIIRANKAAESMLGKPMQKILAQKYFQLYHGTSCAPKNCPSCRCTQTGKPSLTEIFEPHLNKYLELKALPRFDKKTGLSD